MKHPQPSAAVLTAWIQGKNMLGPTSFSQQATLCEGLLVKSNHIFCQTKCFCFARYSTIPILQQAIQKPIGGSSSCPQKTISRHRAIVRSTSCGPFSAWSCNPAPPYMPSIDDWIMVSWDRYESKSLRTHEKYGSLIEAIAQGWYKQ